MSLTLSLNIISKPQIRLTGEHGSKTSIDGPLSEQGFEDERKNFIPDVKSKNFTSEQARPSNSGKSNLNPIDKTNIFDFEISTW